MVVVGTARPALVESRHEDEAVLAGETVVVAAARAGRAVGVARCVSHPLSPTEADAALQVSAGRALGHTGSRLVVQIERALARETVVVGGSVAGGAVVTAGPTDRVLLEVAGVALGPAGRAIGDGEQLGGTGETFFVGAARAGGAHPVALETLGSDLVGAGGAGVRDTLCEVRDVEVGGLAGGARVVFVRDAGLALVVAGFAVGERRRVEARAALLNAHLELRHELFAGRALQTVAGAGSVAPLARLVAVCMSSAPHQCSGCRPASPRCYRTGACTLCSSDCKTTRGRPLPWECSSHSWYRPRCTPPAASASASALQIAGRPILLHS